MPFVAKSTIACSYGIIREGGRIPKSIPKSLLDTWKKDGVVVDSKSKEAPPTDTADAIEEYAD